MPNSRSYDAVVIGAGPNGLAAGITLAHAGQSVAVIEARETIGGGVRSAELTLPGFRHDVCSTAHPLGLASPFFRNLPLADYGLQFIQPPAALAHPFDDGSAALLELSIADTAESLGPDGRAYRKLMEPLLADLEKILSNVLGPLPVPPTDLMAMARFSLPAVQSAAGLAGRRFKGERARALLAGISAHVMLPLTMPISASFGLVLGVLAHAGGWPFVKGGSQNLAEALAGHLRALGGTIQTGRTVRSMQDVPPAGSVLFDLTPRQILEITGEIFPQGYRRQLGRFRYGPGVFKVDWALSEPIPWRAPEVARAGVVHLGGTLSELVEAEAAVWRGEHAERPYVLLAQPTLFDPGRAPAGKHIAWAYCHVPSGSTFDMLSRIEDQVERFAPGFCDTILARSVMNAQGMESYNPNYVGGDINGGVQDIFQLFTRPVPRLSPYTTPVRGIYICSSSTPPGGGVHGMCGYHAARAALRAGPHPLATPRSSILPGLS